MAIKTLNKLGKQFRKFACQFSYLRIGVKCKYSWHGNQYGGFFIAEEFINNKSIVYSFGIGEDTSFDESIMKKYGCQVFGFDPTPKSINWVKNKKLPKEFIFFEFGIGNESGTTDFFLPKNKDHVSGSIFLQKNVENKITVNVKTLQDILKELEHSHIDVLKMDIEGAEYSVIEDIINSKIFPDQILVEFHDRFFNDGKERTRRTLELLRQNGYEIFALSSSFQEISLIKKSLF